MRTSMQSPYFLILIFLISGGASRVEDGPEATWQIVAERHALVALKQALGNHHLLNNTWSGVQCFLNQTTWYGLRCINNRVASISLESLGLSGRIDDHRVLADLTELTHLSFKNNSISGTMMDFSTNINLTNIDLSMNMFSGPISNSLLGLDLLTSLQLNDNHFIDSLPPLNQSSLRSFNVSHNNLTGKIPDTLTLQSFNWTSFIGSSGLCSAPSLNACRDNESKSEPKSSTLTKPRILAIVLILNLILVFILIWGIYLYRKKTRKVEIMSKGEGVKLVGDVDCEEKRVVVIREEHKEVLFVNGGGGFDCKDLSRASTEELGKGSFGSCYKAIFDDERSLVMKRMKDVCPLTSKEFVEHVNRIAALKHPNLLPLLGYHYSAEEKLLVYHFARKGNLFNRIHGERGPSRVPFDWSSRLSAAKDIARAMEYLHLTSNAQLAVPHGNLKASNVLLDENDTAFVTDYGLAPIVPPSLRIQRMVSYQSPECQHRHRKLSNKSDVWSYGCLLVELVTGKMPSFSAPEGMEGVDVGSWVRQAVREEWTWEVIDVELAVRPSAMQGILLLLQLALRCCEESPEKRPDMAQVLKEVEAIRPSESDDEEQEDEEDYSSEQSIAKKSSSSFDSGAVVEDLSMTSMQDV